MPSLLGAARKALEEKEARRRPEEGVAAGGEVHVGEGQVGLRLGVLWWGWGVGLYL